jgi:DNA-binding NarL/FixJ family response regulator
MAGKLKRMSQVKQIQQLHSQGFGNKTIARNLDISKNTVKGYLGRYLSSKLSLASVMIHYCPN